MRRWLLPFVALLAAAVAVAVALHVPRSPATGGEPSPRAAAAVLSLRRVPTLVSRAVADGRLHRRLSAVMADPGLGAAARASCLVVEQGDRSLFEVRSDLALIPASNLKVLTGVAAVEQLGAGERLRTEARADGALQAGVVEGRLWLVGGGDPLLGTADYAATFPNQPQLFTPLETLADRIVAAGVREVRGGVAGDESRYDAVRYVPSWRRSYITDNESGPMSALVVNDGFAQYGARKVASGAPATHAASVLTALLQARGVVVAGAPTEGRAPASATVVASLDSHPVGEIVGQMLAESDNLTAELLIKELGRRVSGTGSTEAGLAAFRQVLADRRLDVAALAAADGSGLDRSDRASCGLLLDALDLEGPDSALADGFPVAGRSGTLTKRFKGHPAEGRLRAKTGSLDYVVGLTGYVEGPDGGPLEFSLLANELPDRSERGRLLQEQVGAVLAAYPEAPDPATLGPVPG